MPEYIEIEFSEGVPVSLNGEVLKLADLIQKLNEIAENMGLDGLTTWKIAWLGLNQEKSMSVQVQ